MKVMPVLPEAIVLESVATVIELATGLTYPQLEDGSYEPAGGEEIPLGECCEDWWDVLSPEDYAVATAINEKTKHLWV